MYIYNQKELSIFWGLPPTIPPLFSSYIKQKKITNGKNYYIKRDFNFRSISALQNLKTLIRINKKNMLLIKYIKIIWNKLLTNKEFKKIFLSYEYFL
jgi:hypothetical protein